MSASQRYQLRCRECGTEWGNQPISFCQKCFAPLEVVYDLPRIREIHFIESNNPRSDFRRMHLLPEHATADALRHSFAARRLAGGSG